MSLDSGPTFVSATTSSTATLLRVSGVATFTASYTISQGALDSGRVLNSVVATASSPGQTNNVSDTSDNGNDGDGNTTDDKTITTITASPSIEVTKTVTVTDNGDGVNGKGDIVQYTIAVQNTGNITLSGLTVSDTFTDANSNTLSLSSGPTFSGANQSSAQGILKVNETATYTALYIIQQTAIDTGKIINYAVATSSSPGQSNNVTDTSDNGIDNDGNTIDDVTELSITASPSLEVTKTAAVADSNGDGKTGLSDVINYIIKVENKGNVSLTSLTLIDTITDGSGGVLSLNAGPSYGSTTMGSLPGELKVGEVQTYTGYHIISGATANTGSVINSAVATASSPGQSNNVSDTSDDGDDTDGNLIDDPTITAMTPDPSIEVTKTVSVTDVNLNTINDVGDILTYEIIIENTGNVTVTALTLADTLTDNNGNALSLDSGPTYLSATSGSTSTTIKAAGSVTYTATYTLTAAPALSGKIKNTVLATASSPGNTADVIDISDNGDDNDGNIYNDQTEVSTTAQASLTVTKSAVVSQTNGNSTTEAGDVITYTIGIKNTGGVILTGLSLIDTLTDANSNTLSLSSGPTFLSASAGSTSITLVTSGVVTYTASYTIQPAASYTGKIINKVVATATVQGGSATVSDTSDDPSTAAPNDVTVVNIDPFSQIEVTKTASVTDQGDNYVGAGDVINYIITVENKGNVTLTGLTVTDTLTDANSNTLSLSSGPSFSGANQN